MPWQGLARYGRPWRNGIRISTRFAGDPRMKTDVTPSRACPTFFRRLCRDASRGGQNGYRDAGYRLVGALGSLGPYRLTDDEWAERLEEFNDLADPSRWVDR